MSGEEGPRACLNTDLARVLAMLGYSVKAHDSAEFSRGYRAALDDVARETRARLSEECPSAADPPLRHGHGTGDRPLGGLPPIYRFWVLDGSGPAGVSSKQAQGGVTA